MKEKSIPFWEKSYQRPGKLDTFGGGEPGEDVIFAVSRVKEKGKALDIGCGEGRNAIYLAKMGFDTTAFDISVSGIEKLKLVSKEQNLKINSKVCDMRNFEFKEIYSLIVCQGCLHLIYKNEWKRVVNMMKASTEIGGYNVVGIFTDEVPEPEDQRGLMVGLANDGDLFEAYSDWEIIEKKKYQFEHEHPDGPKHKHSGNRLIARRK
jgi:tellurite methyltransferase